MRRTFLTLAAALVAACAPAEKADVPVADAPSLTVTDDFKTPESVLYDSVADLYLVSNINGTPFDKDNNGFISRVVPDGKVATLSWIAGGARGATLHAPKGMAIKADTLFVADIDEVRRFHRVTGDPLGAIAVPGATFLNDLVVARDGTLYATDSGLKPGPGGFAPSGTDAVYKFGADGTPEAIMKGSSLGRPNGLAMDGADPVVVSFGTGDLYMIEHTSGAKMDFPKPPRGELDGLLRLPNGTYFMSSWEANAVYRWTQSGGFTVEVDSVVSPADIGWDSKRSRVLIPLFNENRIEIRKVM